MEAVFLNLWTFIPELSRWVTEDSNLEKQFTCPHCGYSINKYPRPEQKHLTDEYEIAFWIYRCPICNSGLKVFND